MTQATSGQIHELVDHYVPLLGLESWDIKVTFGGTTERADCTAMSEYFEAALRFDLREIPSSEAPAYVRHELLHCLVDELHRPAAGICGKSTKDVDDIDFHAERLTTLLERLPVWDHTTPHEEH